MQGWLPGNRLTCTWTQAPGPPTCRAQKLAHPESLVRLNGDRLSLLKPVCKDWKRWRDGYFLKCADSNTRLQGSQRIRETDTIKGTKTSTNIWPQRHGDLPDKWLTITALKRLSELQGNTDSEMNQENNTWTKREAQQRERNHKKEPNNSGATRPMTELKSSIGSFNRGKNQQTQRQVIWKYPVRETKRKGVKKANRT